MKTIRVVIKNLKHGGLLTPGYATVCPVLREEDGEEIELGDYYINSDNSAAVQQKLSAVKVKYENLGYEPVGDW